MAADGWLISSICQTRDSDVLDESNFVSALQALGGESETVQVLRFGHWAVGWTEWIAVLPQHSEALQALEDKIDDYPVLDEDDLSEREQEAAYRIWADCYSPAERLEYIRRYRSQFDFCNFKDLMGCVRGRYFAGYAGDLVNRR